MDICLCSHLTLETLGQVTKIEDIVGFSWSGQQVDTQTSVYLHRGIHDLTSTVFYCLGKLTEKSIQDGLEEFGKQRNKD